HFKFTEFCANLAINHRKAIYAVCVTSVCVGLFGISKLKVENSFIGYFKESTEIYGGMAVIDKELGGTVPLDVVIKFGNNSAQNSQISQSEDDEFDEFEAEFAENQNKAQYWFSSDKMRIINKTHDFLKEQEFIGNVGSLSTLLKIGKNLNDGKELDDFMLAVMYNELPENYRKMVLSPYINIEANEAHFAIRTVDSDKNLRRNEFLNNLRANLQNLLKDDDVQVQVSGVMVLYNNMLQSLVSSQFGTLSFTLLVLFAIFIVIFKSLKFALMAIVVNLIPLSLGFGIMGLVGIPLDIMSITIAAISIGMGVDNSIHYIHRYKQEIASNSAQNAVLNSHKSIGYAMYYTSFAVILGFSVMSISNFWPTIYFGLLIDLVMALLLLGALIILPSLILTFGKKVS
ncbi:MAG: MMPL family transporter, partial [Campylobacter sp.]|nr:MMPL family transporter [Campylobacter sp.]